MNLRDRAGGEEKTYVQARISGKMRPLGLQSMCEQVSFPSVFLDGCLGCVNIGDSCEAKVFCST